MINRSMSHTKWNKYHPIEIEKVGIGGCKFKSDLNCTENEAQFIAPMSLNPHKILYLFIYCKIQII